jgi:dual oxidase
MRTCGVEAESTYRLSLCRWYALMIIHGSGRLVQEPIFFYFLLPPLTLFVLDRLVTTSRRKIEIPVLHADLLPSS